VAQRAGELLGVGPLTSSALAATVPDATVFKSGRQFSAWLGLTPRQHSSGGKTRLGRISLRGNVYLRTLLIHGGRSAVYAARRRSDPRSSWLNRLREISCHNVEAVALANKNARVAWAMLRYGEDYRASRAHRQSADLAAARSARPANRALAFASHRARPAGQRREHFSAPPSVQTKGGAKNAKAESKKARQD